MTRRIFLFAALGFCLSAGIGWWAYTVARPIPAVSFYHWKTAYDPGPASQDALRRLGSPRLYLRFFDVTSEGSYDSPAFPTATAIFLSPPELPVVPVVFIDQSILRRAEWSSHTVPRQPELGTRIVRRVEEMIRQNNLTPAKELQLDCDWTQSTREDFFSLLVEAKKALPADWALSVTLRLSQYRDFADTGVPPADRVALMLYNMGQLREFGDHNSILDPVVAAGYLKPVGYPLPLDVALPLFSWGVVFDRNHEYRGLARELPPNLNDPQAFSRETPMLYKALADTRWSGNILHEGDYLRLERTVPKDLEVTAALAAKVLGHVDNVIFYHLDDAVLAPFDPDFLHDIAAQLR